MIYFIKIQDYIKIGFTYNIKKRIKDFQTYSPYKIEIVGLIKGSMKEEKSLHEKFKHLSANGEWFDLTKELKDFIVDLDDTLMWEYGYSSKGLAYKSTMAHVIENSPINMTSICNNTGITIQNILHIQRREEKGTIRLITLREALNKIGYELQMRAIKKSGVETPQ